MRFKTIKMKSLIYILMGCLLLIGCKNPSSADDHHDDHDDELSLEHIHITARQSNALQLKTDVLKKRNIGESVSASGQLKVPPQNEAVITSIYGANIKQILVNQGQAVKKGEVLAYLAHPDLIGLQTEYLKVQNELGFLLSNYERQKRLYEEGVAAGRVYQQANMDYQQAKERAKGLEAQLRLLNISLSGVKSGRIYEQVPVLSAIDGFVQQVNIRTGQFVEPQTTLFELVNPSGIYAELKVYERDAGFIKEGQEVNFETLNSGTTELSGEVSSVGKAFGNEAKAISVIVKLNDSEALIPGTYVKARIRGEKLMRYALPEEALIEVEGKTYVFVGAKKGDDWDFSAVEVKTGKPENGWVAIDVLDEVSEGSLFAYNNAYYILAEAQKGLGGYDH